MWQKLLLPDVIGMQRLLMDSSFMEDSVKYLNLLSFIQKILANQTDIVDLNNYFINDYKKSVSKQKLTPNLYIIVSILALADQKTLAVGRSHGKTHSEGISLWDIQTCQKSKVLEVASDNYLTFIGELSQNIILVQAENDALVVDKESKKCLSLIQNVRQLVILSENQYITFSNDGYFRIWDITQDKTKPIFVNNVTYQKLDSLMLLLDRKTLVATESKKLLFWEMNNFENLNKTPKTTELKSIVFNRNVVYLTDTNQLLCGYDHEKSKLIVLPLPKYGSWNKEANNKVILLDGTFVTNDDQGIAVFDSVSQNPTPFIMHEHGHDKRHADIYSGMSMFENGVIACTNTSDPNNKENGYDRSYVNLWQFQVRPIQYSDIALIIDALKFNHSVKKLNLSGISITEEDSVQLMDLIANSKSLIEINLTNTQLSAKSIHQLIIAIKQNTSLESVLFIEDPLSPIMSQLERNELNAHFEKHRRGDSIPLSTHASHDLKYIILFEQDNSQPILEIKKPSALSRLDIWCAAVTLKNNPNIFELILCTQDLTIEHLSILLEAMKEHPGLSIVNFSHNQLGNVHCKMVCEAAKQLNLTTLLLSDNNINDESTNNLIDLLCTTPSLRKIDLSHNQLTDVTGKKLAELLTSTDHIASLNIEKNRFGLITIHQLIAAVFLNNTIQDINMGENVYTLHLNDIMLLKSQIDKEFPTIDQARINQSIKKLTHYCSTMWSVVTSTPSFVKPLIYQPQALSHLIVVNGNRIFCASRDGKIYYIEQNKLPLAKSFSNVQAVSDKLANLTEIYSITAFPFNQIMTWGKQSFIWLFKDNQWQQIFTLPSTASEVNVLSTNQFISLDTSNKNINLYSWDNVNQQWQANEHALDKGSNYFKLILLSDNRFILQAFNAQPQLEQYEFNNGGLSKIDVLPLAQGNSVIDSLCTEDQLLLATYDGAIHVWAKDPALSKWQLKKSLVAFSKPNAALLTISHVLQLLCCSISNSKFVVFHQDLPGIENSGELEVWDIENDKSVQKIIPAVNWTFITKSNINYIFTPIDKERKIFISQGFDGKKYGENGAFVKVWKTDINDTLIAITEIQLNAPYSTHPYPLSVTADKALIIGLGDRIACWDLTSLLLLISVENSLDELKKIEKIKLIPRVRKMPAVISSTIWHSDRVFMLGNSRSLSSSVNTPSFTNKNSDLLPTLSCPSQLVLSSKYNDIGGENLFKSKTAFSMPAKDFQPIKLNTDLLTAPNSTQYRRVNVDAFPKGVKNATREDFLNLQKQFPEAIFILPDNYPDCILPINRLHTTGNRGGLAAVMRPNQIGIFEGVPIYDLSVIGMPTLSFADRSLQQEDIKSAFCKMYSQLRLGRKIFVPYNQNNKPAFGHGVSSNVDPSLERFWLEQFDLLEKFCQNAIPLSNLDSEYQKSWNNSDPSTNIWPIGYGEQTVLSNATRKLKP